MAFAPRIESIFAPTPISQTPRFGAAGMGGGDDEDFLGQAISAMEPAFHKVRNRNLADEQARMEMRSGFEYNQRMREMFDPNLRLMRSMNRARGGMDLATGMPTAGGGGMNVVFDPGPQKDKGMNDYQRASLDLEKAKMRESSELSSRKLASDEDQERRRLALESEKHALDKTKNSQIFDVKNRELEQKALDTQAKLEQAEKKLAADQSNQAAMAAHRQAQIDAVNARHELDIARRDAQLAETTRMNNARIKELEARLAGTTTEETITDDQGRTSKKTSTRTPNAKPSGDMVAMIGPDGKTRMIPKDKVADARKNYRMQPVSERQ